MDKTTQDLAWSVLPKEFKKEVKAHYAGLNAAYKAYLSKDSLSNEECDRCNVLREKMALYQMYFGIDNLTSDAEGEEMLCVTIIICITVILIVAMMCYKEYKLSNGSNLSRIETELR